MQYCKKINKYIQLLMLKAVFPVANDTLFSQIQQRCPFSPQDRTIPVQNKSELGEGHVVNHLAFKICPESEFSLSSKCRAVLQSHLPPSTDVTFDLLLWLRLKGGKHAIPCCQTQAADEFLYNACSIVRSLWSAILLEHGLHFWLLLNLRDTLQHQCQNKSHRLIRIM